MDLRKLSPLQDRKVFGVLMAVGSLLFIAPLYLVLSQHRAGPASPKLLLLFLAAPVLYLVCRYARTSVMVKVLAVCLIAASAWVASVADPIHDRDWLPVVAAGALTGLGLLLGIRWSAYLWYGVALALLAVHVDFFHQFDAADNWQHPTGALVLLCSLLLLIFCAGGSIAVARHFRATRAAPGGLPSIGLSGAKAAKLFAILCVACALLVAAHWVANRIPDTDGVAQLHPTLRPIARGGDRLPQCDRVTYCGAYVELSCRPEADGPVSYYNNKSGALVMNCGGACWGGQGPAGTTRCSACPPPEWSNCASSRASAPR